MGVGEAGMGALVIPKERTAWQAGKAGQWQILAAFDFSPRQWRAAAGLYRVEVDGVMTVGLAPLLESFETTGRDGRMVVPPAPTALR